MGSSLNGFIKLHRKLVAWGWYQDYVVKDVFLHLLLTANFRDTEWKGTTLKKGQLIIGTKRLAEDLGFTRQQVRTALNKLKSTNEITIDTTNRYSLVTIVNWNEYQSDDDIATNKSTKILTNNQPTYNQQITNKQPTDNQQKTTPKEIKNDRNIEYKIIDDSAYYNNINNNIKAPAPPSESGEVFKSYEQNIGVISPIVVDILKDRIQSQGAELVMLAITEAVKNNAKTIRYIEKVLNAWDNDGIKTADAARLRIAERSQRVNSKDTLPKNVQNSSFRNYPGDVLGDAEKEAIRKMMANTV